MSKSTISTFKLFELFPNEETAREYLEDRLWSNGPVCPECKSGDRITKRAGGFYRCNACKLDFTVRMGTIFERSHVPLHKWVYAMYLLVTARKGISSLQLAKEIGVTQKTAWFILGRLREACGGSDTIGGKEANKHESKKLHAGRGPVGKVAVLGMRERGGRTLAMPIADRTLDNIHGQIHGNVEVGTQLYTDDHIAFSDLDGLFYRHDTVNHSIGEYSRGPASTNSIESVWAVLKRGVHGVYHHVSPKHLARYVDEFTFRLNEGDVKRHTLARLDSFVGAIAGKRLTYKELTA
ncbi:MAG TPA: IS1595 family transposase [Hyphomicrobiaceae bacterium]|nr:IS1595 family transposase [Hyphomicrobiaceae bacterium]